jgi:hypothetical protein
MILVRNRRSITQDKIIDEKELFVKYRNLVKNLWSRI